MRADLADPGRAARRQHRHRVADRQRTGLDAAEITAAGRVVRTRDVLHGIAQRTAGGARADRRRFQHLQQRGTGVPVKISAALDDHVARQRRHRHEAHGGVVDAGALRERAEIGDDARVVLFAEVHEVHLVDGDHQMRNAEQMRERGVPARLLDDAVARVDQQDRELRRARGRDHVARVLLVSRRIRDDELAQRGGEVAIGDIDRDALLALGGQAIGEQRQVERLAALLRRARHGGELVGENCLGVVQ